MYGSREGKSSATFTDIVANAFADTFTNADKQRIVADAVPNAIEADRQNWLLYPLHMHMRQLVKLQLYYRQFVNKV